MSKGTLSFNLPEEFPEFYQSLRGPDYTFAMESFREWLNQKIATAKKNKHVYEEVSKELEAKLREVGISMSQ